MTYISIQFDSSLSSFSSNIEHFCIAQRSGIEVIKLEFVLKLKLKRNDWLLADTSLHFILSLVYSTFDY